MDRKEAHALLDALSTALAGARAEPWARDAAALREYLRRRMLERRFL
ncbi:MAG: hypothetical protein QOE90_945 [Thermoplasmata archaeon]|nr:hypothetical protein [Thermoplasmata archaeon]